MSVAYWPGQLIQTLSISSNQLSINPGNTVTLPAGGAVSIYSTASISTLTVSTINGVPPENLDVAAWSEFPVVSTIYVNLNNINDVSTINGQTANFSTINTNVLNATSTIHSISSISSSVLEVQEITNLSSINGQSLSTLAGAADWSLYPAVQQVDMAGYSLSTVGTINANALTASNTNVGTAIFNSNIGENFAYITQTSQNVGFNNSIT
jgi:hypothetical protein